MPGGTGANAAAVNAGYARNASQFGPVGTGTGVGSAAASGHPLASGGGGNGLLFALMGVQALGTAATSYAQSKALKAEGEFQSEIYQSNARIQALRAEDAVNRGEKSAKRAKEAASRLIGSQRAALGAQGIDIESGSALDIQEETASLGAEDALNIRNNAWREAWGFRVEEQDLKSKAKFAKITAGNKSRNTILTGGLTIAKDLGSQYYRTKTNTSLADYLSGGF